MAALNRETACGGFDPRIPLKQSRDSSNRKATEDDGCEARIPVTPAHLNGAALQNAHEPRGAERAAVALYDLVQVAPLSVGAWFVWGAENCLDRRENLIVGGWDGNGIPCRGCKLPAPSCDCCDGCGAPPSAECLCPEVL